MRVKSLGFYLSLAPDGAEQTPNHHQDPLKSGESNAQESPRRYVESPGEGGSRGAAGSVRSRAGAGRLGRAGIRSRAGLAPGGRGGGVARCVRPGAPRGGGGGGRAGGGGGARPEEGGAAPQAALGSRSLPTAQPELPWAGPALIGGRAGRSEVLCFLC